jgi:NADH-quinone oxidoreductase subunit J
MTLVFFAFFAGVTVFSALAVAWQNNLMYSAFFLLATFMGIAALFLLLGADFLAVTQLLIYVGGILTLMLFGILITKRRNIRFLSSGIQNNKISAVIALSLFSMLVYLIQKESVTFASSTADKTSTHVIGYGLIMEYMLPFELAGVLLLIVLVGILALASSIKTR